MGARIESIVIMSTTIDDVTGPREKFDLVKYRDIRRTENWSYGLVSYHRDLNDLGWEEGVDVQELDEDSAIQILGNFFNIHITDKHGVCHF